MLSQTNAMKPNKRRRWFAVTLITAFVFLALLFGLSTWRTNRPAYRFLKEHKPVWSDSVSVFHNLRSSESRVFSFEGDYDRICEGANSELLPKGYFCQKETVPRSRSHTFRIQSTREGEALGSALDIALRA